MCKKKCGCGRNVIPGKNVCYKCSKQKNGPRKRTVTFFVLLAVLAGFGLYGLSNASADSGWWECRPGDSDPETGQPASQNLCQSEVDRRMRNNDFDTCDWSNANEAYQCAIESEVISHCTAQVAAFWLDADPICLNLPTATATLTPTATSTETPSPSATPTATPTGTLPPTSTMTPTPVSTATPIATSTALPPTVTPTQIPGGPGIRVNVNVYLATDAKTPPGNPWEMIWVAGNPYGDQTGPGWHLQIMLDNVWSEQIGIHQDHSLWEFTEPRLVIGQSLDDVSVSAPIGETRELEILSKWIWVPTNGDHPAYWKALEPDELEQVEDRLIAIGIQLVD